MKSFIHDIPKAELHIHIEGSLEPGLMFAIAEKNNISLPFDSIADLKKAYEFSNLQSFLDIYYQGANVLVKEQDFYELTRAYLKKAYEQNVRHTEIFFDPQTHTNRGIEFGTVLSGISRAMDDAANDYEISSGLIMCFLRHLSVGEAMETLEQALDFKKQIIAVGLDSSEYGFPPELFIPVFDKAQKEGFVAVAHAGEEGPPEYIRQAVEQLNALRIDHGVQCIHDHKVTTILKERRIPLTVCPLSNVKLRIFNDITTHNLKQLLDLGLCVTVNSDDPAYFGGYIEENFHAVQRAFHLGTNDIYKLVKNSFRASFISDHEKLKFFDELDDFMNEYMSTDMIIHLSSFDEQTEYIYTEETLLPL